MAGTYEQLRRSARRELLTMANQIGVGSKWIQAQGTWKEHFDICLSKRRLAVAAGAVAVSQGELAARLAKRRFLTHNES